MGDFRLRGELFGAYVFGLPEDDGKETAVSKIARVIAIETSTDLTKKELTALAERVVRIVLAYQEED